MPDGVLGGADVDEDVVAVELDREPPQLVGPLVEGPAGREIEPRVVPVARENPVADRAAMQREAHVRAAVVDGVHQARVRDQAHRVPLDVDDEPLLRAHVGERRSAHEARGLYGGHPLLLLVRHIEFVSE